MKSSQIQIGSVYMARVSGRDCNVRVDAIRETSNVFFTRSRKVFDVTNLRTGRKLTFRSAAKFRSLVTVERAARELNKALNLQEQP